MSFTHYPYAYVACVAALLAAGCGDDVATCVSAADCADDQVCVNGECSLAAADAGGDATEPDGGTDAGDPASDAGDDGALPDVRTDTNEDAGPCGVCPDVRFCDVETAVCVECNADSECLCLAGECVECTIDDESACGVFTCDLATNTCSTTTPNSVEPCGACGNDRDCLESLNICADRGDGTTRCFSSNDFCRRPFVLREMATRLDGSEQEVCTPPPSCETYLAAGQDCSGDDECGPDGSCGAYADSPGLVVCSYACTERRECPRDSDCEPGGFCGEFRR